MAVEADEYYDGDELAPASKKKRLQNSKLFIGFSLLALAFAGSTIAANITLSSGRIEFGQGVYQIQACDQYVGIEPQRGTGEDLDYVKKIVISGLDALNCPGRDIRINLYSNSAPTVPLVLFEGDQGIDLNRVLLRVSTDSNTVRATAVGFVTGNRSRNRPPAVLFTQLQVDGSGRVNDSHQILTYTQSSGLYIIEFAVPLALVEDVDRFTIQSSIP